MDRVPETPEEIEAYVENSKRIESLTEFVNDQYLGEMAAEWTALSIKMLDYMSESGMEHTECASALGGMTANLVLQWGLDGQARNQ